MATKVNLAMAATLFISWGALSAVDTDLVVTEEQDLDGLARLEDLSASDRSDARLARVLADRYLELDEPRLAVMTLMEADAEVRESPDVLHRLAKAYEATGRMEDAHATAQLAVARCGRALGTRSAATPVPAHDCTEGSYAALSMHERALGHMVRWGVTDIEHDRRAARAYALATRSARIVSADF